jgi:hypothetical protein
MIAQHLKSMGDVAVLTFSILGTVLGTLFLGALFSGDPLHHSGR